MCNRNHRPSENRVINGSQFSKHNQRDGQLSVAFKTNNVSTTDAISLLNLPKNSQTISLSTTNNSRLKDNKFQWIPFQIKKSNPQSLNDKSNLKRIHKKGNSTSHQRKNRPLTFHPFNIPQEANPPIRKNSFQVEKEQSFQPPLPIIMTQHNHHSKLVNETSTSSELFPSETHSSNSIIDPPQLCETHFTSATLKKDLSVKTTNSFPSPLTNFYLKASMKALFEMALEYRLIHVQ
nr:unnamed protein product [Naegleria fowleri]